MPEATTDFWELSKVELQELCRTQSKAKGMATSWVASASKESMVAWLSGKPVENKPESDPKSASNDLAALIAAAVQPLIKANASLDVGAVEALIDAKLSVLTMPREVKIQVNDAKPVTFKHAHAILPDVVQTLLCGLHVWLVGPAGSGKTTIAHQAADTLGLQFSCVSVCSQTAASSLLGYMDATGKYVRTLFRERFEHGGLFCLDEIDNGNANVLSVLNAALANGTCAFPDAMIARHADFRLVACANTYGNGADATYVGRNPIDGATLDRFKGGIIDVAYDESLERAIAGNDEWVNYVIACRKAAIAHKVKCVISPRASINGAKLLAQGVSRDKVEARTLFAGLSAESIAKIKAGV
jgi:cobaltochelatase CobS